MKTERLELSKTCWFEVDTYGIGDRRVCLEYLERSPDPYYSDSTTDIDISEERAREIIEFLTRAFSSIGGGKS